MSLIREHIIKLLEKDEREDGRKLDEYREVVVEYGISAKSAEGSARVKIGKTEVVAGVKTEVGQPYPDSPDKGNLIVNAEFTPLASPDFESGPPSIDAIELARVVDRGLRESEAVDFKKLCIKKGEKVWTILVDVYPINDDGNLFDAAALAALAAVKDAKFPTYDEKTEIIDYMKRTKKPLPLNKEPIGITVLKIKNKFVVDPLRVEEKSADARLTVVVEQTGNLCAMQKGGEEPLSVEDIGKMVDLALIKSKELRSKF